MTGLTEIRRLNRKIERIESLRLIFSNNLRYMFGQEYDQRVKDIAEMDAQIAALKLERDAADEAYEASEARQNRLDILMDMH